MNDITGTDQPTPETFSSGQTTTNSVRLYAISGIGCFLLAGLIWIVSQPEERTGPPVNQDASAPSADPHAADHAGMQARIDELRRTVASGTASPEDQLLLANLLYDQGVRHGDRMAFQESSKFYESYLERVPDNPDARTDYAFTLSQIGRLDEGIEELLSVQRQYPRHQNSAFNLAVMYKEKDLPDSVLFYMEKTAAIDSTSRTGQAALEVLKAYSGAH